MRITWAKRGHRLYLTRGKSKTRGHLTGCDAAKRRPPPRRRGDTVYLASVPYFESPLTGQS
ncbi:hypothetical protein J6590_039232 [Homalodisca vitripennis]|nr:hypothetical protein J6590_039232 [Homalodisca vitripennis]